MHCRFGTILIAENTQQQLEWFEARHCEARRRRGEQGETFVFLAKQNSREYRFYRSYHWMDPLFRFYWLFLSVYESLLRIWYYRRQLSAVTQFSNDLQCKCIYCVAYVRYEPLSALMDWIRSIDDGVPLNKYSIDSDVLRSKNAINKKMFGIRGILLPLYLGRVYHTIHSLQNMIVWLRECVCVFCRQNHKPHRGDRGRVYRIYFLCRCMYDIVTKGKTRFAGWWRNPYMRNTYISMANNMSIVSVWMSLSDWGGRAFYGFR